MREKSNLTDKAVTTAAAAAMHKGMLPWLLAFIANRSTPTRTPFTLADQMAATVPGYGSIRFFADSPQAGLAAQQDHILPPNLKQQKRQTWLALSSGGAGGAFGAGVLTGWTTHGDRPQFNLVTGVSAGALLAPFAFVGPRADMQLAKLFTAASVVHINQDRSLLAGIFGQSAIPAKPLRALIDTYVTAGLIEHIAERHRAGARLLVVTTNLDAQRSVVWNVGAIAASDHPGRLRLIGDVLEASASIPAIFPPVRIAVTGNGKAFEELHADGGAVRQLYLLPDAFLDIPAPAQAGADIFVILNAELGPSFSVIPQQSIQVAARALSSLEKSSAQRSVAEIANFAHQNKANFRLVYLDRAIPVDRHVPFDPNFMQRAFALGHAKGLAGSWAFAAPTGTDLLEDE